MVYLENGQIVAKKLGVKSVEQLEAYEKEFFPNSSTK